jgi:glycosyltransferase involved in cell wall biosynthesis
MYKSADDHRPEVSVIIPIYNAGPHLRACLDSCVKQTLQNIEIVCVDDCSADDSCQIVTEYANNDSRMRLLSHNENQGEGASRNTGLDNANGRFVFHLDADDTIPLNALESLYFQADTNCSDMVKGSYVRLYEDKEPEIPAWTISADKIVNTNIFESEFLQAVPTVHCSYLYNRDFLNRHDIRYVTDLSIGLDLVTLANTLVKATKVTLIPDVVYHYHQSGDSATRRQVSEITLMDAIKAKRRVSEILDAANLPEASNRYLQSWAWQITEYWINMARTHALDTCRNIFSQFRALVSHRVVPWRENTQPQIRYLLALILAHQDEKAVAFLKTKEISNGFSGSDELKTCLSFVLSQVPDDIGALHQLGMVAIEENKPLVALELFETVLQHDSNHFDVQLQLSAVLRSLGRLDDARRPLHAAQEILESRTDQARAVRQLINQNCRLAYEDKQLNVAKLNTINTRLKQRTKELKATRRELESVYASRSWRITLPLRKLFNLLSG